MYERERHAQIISLERDEVEHMFISSLSGAEGEGGGGRGGIGSVRQQQRVHKVPRGRFRGEGGGERKSLGCSPLSLRFPERRQNRSRTSI